MTLNAVFWVTLKLRPYMLGFVAQGMHFWGGNRIIRVRWGIHGAMNFGNKWLVKWPWVEKIGNSFVFVSHWIRLLKSPRLFRSKSAGRLHEWLKPIFFGQKLNVWFLATSSIRFSSSSGKPTYFQEVASPVQAKKLHVVVNTWYYPDDALCWTRRVWEIVLELYIVHSSFLFCF